MTFLAFDFLEGNYQFHFWDAKGKHSIRIGIGMWLESSLNILAKQVTVAVSGTWRTSKTIEMIIRILGTAFSDTWTSDFITSAARISINRNIWNTSEIPDLTDVALFPNLVGYLVEE
ncbi:hypothetical protein KHA96_10355 [Bacillus sp. FJAT-49711]|uniref:hypothetical protein n=1 Tax=Bacillus sp. FJAT-49711 TaxID=2833585 RepID=UPI001BC9BFEC|nr:hypothetical protein [Bacillus sp. FJAT-49711]MBS4218713.1 hypothetical protein [Bacillus sp. FJAT-49711]